MRKKRRLGKKWSARWLDLSMKHFLANSTTIDGWLTPNPNAPKDPQIAHYWRKQKPYRDWHEIHELGFDFRVNDV